MSVVHWHQKATISNSMSNFVDGNWVRNLKLTFQISIRTLWIFEKKFKIHHPIFRHCRIFFHRRAEMKLNHCTQWIYCVLCCKFKPLYSISLKLYTLHVMYHIFNEFTNCISFRVKYHFDMLAYHLAHYFVISMRKKNTNKNQSRCMQIC